MKVLNDFNVNQINRELLGTSVSIYSLLTEKNRASLLIGCGMWDRENMPHSNAIKNNTPGIILRIDEQNGNILEFSEQLDNIVYPLVENPWGHLFIGCRTGAAYTMEEDLSINQIGSFGNGVYGVAYSKQLDQFLIGGRNGRLYIFDNHWNLINHFQVTDNRLWNLCMDHDDRFVWASSYNHHIFKINIEKMVIDWQDKLDRGAITLINWLENGLLAVGCMLKSVFLMYGLDIIKKINVASPVCFVMDLPNTGTFIATGYKGQIWRFDYAGRLVDEFTLDSRKNNPIWIAQQNEQGNLIFAWANGAIRTISID